MAWYMRSSPFRILTVALALGLAVNVPLQVQAQLRPASLSSQLPLQWEPPRTPGSSAPVNRESGGVRGPCLTTSQKLVALVPASGMGTTTADYPTVFWYMPESQASAVEFMLQDSNNRQVYSVKYNLAKSAEGVVRAPGIMSLTLPALANLSPLKSGQTYKWSVTLICTTELTDNSGNPFVEGTIERVDLAPSLAWRIEQATPKERVALYAQQGAWYETLKTLVELQRDFPRDREVTQALDKLLQSVELDPMPQSSERENISQLNSVPLER
ncbi:MAG TPA: hypothetical protein DCL61_05130 [Cyanobacteria bacterium UBA12227]|nr:hypothetical protein [Cyanobacteria bacterium UBA12227]HAX87406.1 hypothetical protein [Cyanobacteria bacterium UBA11370]